MCQVTRSCVFIISFFCHFLLIAFTQKFGSCFASFKLVQIFGVIIQQNSQRLNEIDFQQLSCHVRLRLEFRSCIVLKLVTAIFCEKFFFSPNDRPLKTTKNVFFISSKNLFSLSRFQICVFSSSPLFLSFSPCQPLLYRLIQ